MTENGDEAPVDGDDEARSIRELTDCYAVRSCARPAAGDARKRVSFGCEGVEREGHCPDDLGVARHSNGRLLRKASECDDA